MSMQAVQIRQEGSRVLVIKGGRAVLDLPYQAALDLAKALHGKARQADEWANAQAVIADQAIVTRLGLRFGLTSNPMLLKEAVHAAAWSRDLRRYIPSSKALGIASQTVIGAPSLISHPRRTA